MSAPSVTPLVELALKELGSTPPTTQSILRLSATLAQAVNKWPGLKGAQKADLVVSALRDVIGLEQIRGLLSAEEQAALRVVVDTVVPETLALMVGAARGEYDFRKPTPGCMAALAAALCRTGAAIAVAAAPGNEAAAQAASVLQTANTVTQSLAVATVAAAEAPAPAPASEKEVQQAEPEKVEVELVLTPAVESKE